MRKIYFFVLTRITFAYPCLMNGLKFNLRAVFSFFLYFNMILCANIKTNSYFCTAFHKKMMKMLQYLLKRVLKLYYKTFKN